MARSAASNRTSISLNESISRKVHALQTLMRKLVHDTNNYYGIIQGYVSLLEARPGDEAAARKYLPPIKEALQEGIALNRRLAAFYRSDPGVMTETDPADTVREVCATYAGEHGFSMEVKVRGDLEPVMLNGPSLRSLVANLCFLVEKTRTIPAVLELETVQLDAKQIGGMALDSPPGGYLRLQTSVSLAEYSQEEETELLNPFALDPVDPKDMGLSLIYSSVLSHGGNLDVTLRDKLLTLALYYPQQSP